MSAKVFYEVLEATNMIALATSVDGIPNVRIVNFCYDKGRPGVLYFASDRENQKVKEFAINPQVAFTTIPSNGESIAHVRSRRALVRKSDLALCDVQENFISRVPGYDETIAAIGESLDVFEIQVQEATVILNFDSVQTVNFE